jgi:hypothetical protein
MNHKSFGWAAVLGCILSVCIAVIGGRESRPPSAQAFLTPSIPTEQDLQACRAVINQMEAIHQTAGNDKPTGQASQLAAMDDLVCREAQIDASKCPADFRQAEGRYVAALNTVSVDAHINFEKNGTPAFQTMFDNGSQSNSSDLAAGASDDMKHDIAATRAAAAQFRQVAAKYDVQW